MGYWGWGVDQVIVYSWPSDGEVKEENGRTRWLGLILDGETGAKE